MVFLILAIALGVIALVLSWRQPQGGMTNWVRESAEGWKKDRLSTDAYEVRVEETDLGDVFSSFEEGDGYLTAEEINENFIDFTASPGAQKVVSGTEQVFEHARRAGHKGADVARQKAAEAKRQAEKRRVARRAGGHPAKAEDTDSAA